MGQVIVALDLGTTGTRAIAFDGDLRPVEQAYVELPQHFPRPGWVEHDPLEIWDGILACAARIRKRIPPERIAAIAITNQRETAVLWDARTGDPVHNAIVWQCRRTADRCEVLKREHGDEVRARTGLVIDAYFSATKIAWILENVPAARPLAREGRLCFGTVDSWAIWKLTGGRVHATDPSNASRTLLYHIHDGLWDPALVSLFGADGVRLPDTRPSISVFGSASRDIFGREIPIAAVLGDQQASLFGQGGFARQGTKNTYGTGLFVMMNTGEQPIASRDLVSTIAWQREGGPLVYALEGSIFVGGAAIQWLRDGLGIVGEAKESERLAREIPDNEGVYFVPALAGLGAPYWDSSARGLIIGLTRATRRCHLARAALESLAYETRDVVDVMQADTGASIPCLQADGAATRNEFLMQFQADLLGVPVERSEVAETTALGAAAAAGIALGLWDEDALLAKRRVDRVFEPALDAADRDRLYGRWREAVRRARGWEGT
ncbi:MAG: glycerol kinase GlpK [Planctomycetes bacterium]|nr:glycerol kinase GlpK [Planctomycetota bacterium]